jgi:acetyl-CoA/propionyl-CoA carboxylase biotin carboxyl carrier protein
VSDVFETVLVANRGEIASRITRTLHRLGVRAVAVHTDADASARHVRDADVAVRVGSYLDADAIVATARATGATAIHPGYGFLAENAAFAELCAAAGVVFIGPSPEAIAVMGDKIRAKASVAARGVPVVPGLAEPGLSDADIAAAIEQIGYPALIKPSAGGGGKGMHVVSGPAEIRGAIASARREAAGAFGDDTLFVERYVARPRHIEVQVLADSFGSIVHLGERECSLQRRHQKVVEEAPSPLIDADTRERIGRDACETAQSVGYTGVGTVEFIVSADRPDEWFFMEMNTRLQVEHPVTELVTGLDLVEQQLRVAAGERLNLTQRDVVLSGHAVEVRLYAEDPEHGFLPSGGRLLVVEEPAGDGIRVDSALRAGLVVSPDYDPMLAKVIAWGADRDEAFARLRTALGRTAVLGPATNLTFLTRLLDDPDVRAGRLDTGLIERRLDDLAAPAEIPDGPVAAALVLLADERRNARPGPWGAVPGFRLGRRAPAVVEFAAPEVRVVVDGPLDDALVSVGDAEPVRAAIQLDDDRAQLRIGTTTRLLWWSIETGTMQLAADGVTQSFATTRGARVAAGPDAAGPDLRSPMPGTVVAVAVEEGVEVAAGDAVVVVEAMKMEHAVRAGTPGIVELRVTVGDRVERGDVLATVRSAETERTT